MDHHCRSKGKDWISSIALVFGREIFKPGFSEIQNHSFFFLINEFILASSGLSCSTWDLSLHRGYLPLWCTNSPVVACGLWSAEAQELWYAGLVALRYVGS